jgi:hypothetical protein
MVMTADHLPGLIRLRYRQLTRNLVYQALTA